MFQEKGRKRSLLSFSCLLLLSAEDAIIVEKFISGRYNLNIKESGKPEFETHIKVKNKYIYDETTGFGTNCKRKTSKKRHEYIL